MTISAAWICKGKLIIEVCVTQEEVSCFSLNASQLLSEQMHSVIQALH